MVEDAGGGGGFFCGVVVGESTSNELLAVLATLGDRTEDAPLDIANF